MWAVGEHNDNSIPIAGIFCGTKLLWSRSQPRKDISRNFYHKLAIIAANVPPMTYIMVVCMQKYTSMSQNRHFLIFSSIMLNGVIDKTTSLNVHVCVHNIHGGFSLLKI